MAPDDPAASGPSTVWLNVYDMSPHNKYTYPLGLGVFHSGVEVYGAEFAFGGHDGEGSGVFQMPPRVGVPGIRLRKSIRMGVTTLGRSEVALVLRSMGGAWSGRSYNILTRNCNHFAKELVRQLCGANVPGWVNRLAALGAILPCAVGPAERDIAPTPPDLNQAGKRTDTAALP